MQRSSLRICINNMSVFASKFELTTGKVEWVQMDDAFDYSQQIARSAYADMLHDTDRNRKYYDALKIGIGKIHAKGKKAYVLDIGTGTGILSLMAANCGADAVFACEFFEPMSQCAERIIALNGFANKIKVIHKGSTQLTVGENGDMPHRANILVTEVFDTELIGEGAVKTFTHAQQTLLEDNPIVIPSSGRIYAAVFESSLVNNFNKLQDFGDKENRLFVKIPETIKKCYGSASVHDMQLSQLPTKEFKLISPPTMVLSFDWTGTTPIKKNETVFHQLRAEKEGIAHGVFMWWDLIMDPDGKIVLNCAPEWAIGPNEDSYAWRDHWMQAVYYFPTNIPLKSNQEFTLVTNHDEFCLWFDMSCGDVKNNYQVPVCECGLHLTSRMRVGMINDNERQSKFSKVLSKIISNDTICLNLSECSLLGHYVTLLGAKKVFCLESNHIFQRVLENVAKFNNLQDRMQWIPCIEEIGKIIPNNEDKVSVIVAEPFFLTSILPWHNLQFWYMKQSLSHILSNNLRTIPMAAEFYLMPVQFEHLWKIRAPVRNIEGFDLKPFDKIIQGAITITDDIIDAQPLWEYTSVALAEPKKFMDLNFCNEIPTQNLICKNKFNFEIDGICNGIVLWVKWILNEEVSINTGPVEDVKVGNKIVWDMYSKQGVFFVTKMEKITSTNQLSYNIQFHVESAMFEYNFKII